MPIVRFRTHEQARRAQELGPPASPATFLALNRFCREVRGESLQPRGLRRYRTIEEAELDRAGIDARQGLKESP